MSTPQTVYPPQSTTEQPATSGIATIIKKQGYIANTQITESVAMDASKIAGATATITESVTVTVL